MSNFAIQIESIANTSVKYKKGIKGKQLDDMGTMLTNALLEHAYNFVSLSAKNEKSEMKFVFTVSPGWTLCGHYIRFEISIPHSGNKWSVSTSIEDNVRTIKEGGKCKFDSKSFSKGDSFGISDIMASVKTKYAAVKHAEAVTHDKELSRVMKLVPAIQKKFDEIAAFCKKNKVSLWMDTYLDCVGSISVLPLDTEAVEGVEEGETQYDVDKLPFIDLGCHMFHSECDCLVRKVDDEE